MKPNELRIGNYIECYDLTFQVMTINQGYVTHPTEMGLFHLRDCKPIPLTERRLMDFGFEINEDYGNSIKNKTHYPVYCLDGFTIAIIDSKFYKWVEIEEDSWHSYGWPELKYIHQLQNLYFFVYRKRTQK